MKKLGQKGASTVTLAFQDCRIPASARMGAEGEGYPLLLRSVVRSRISAAAQGVGFAQGAFDARCDVGCRARPAVLARRPPRRTSSSSWRGSAARSPPPGRCCSSVCDQVDARPRGAGRRGVARRSCTARHSAPGSPRPASSSSGRTATWSSSGVERRLRDAKIAEIYDGTNQIQSMLVARDIRRSASTPSDSG